MPAKADPELRLVTRNAVNVKTETRRRNNGSQDFLFITALTLFNSLQRNE
jgi:hypothetical protein